MVAAQLLRLTLQGALEALGSGDGTVSLPEGARAKLGSPVSVGEIAEAANLLRRPTGGVDGLLLRAVRLGVLTLGLGSAQDQGAVTCRAGYGVLAGDEPTIAVCGDVSGTVVSALAAAGGARLVSLGDWIYADGALLPFACTSGEAEVALSSGRIDLLLLGGGVDPALAALAGKLGIPAADALAAPAAGEMVAAATKQAAKKHPEVALDAAMVGEGQVVAAPGGLNGSKVCFLGGCDSARQSLGWIASEVAPALGGEGISVAAWGDAALWLVKGGAASDERAHPARLVSGPELALGQLDKVGGICFTALGGCRDLGVALGLAGLGARVCVAAPLPLWGSKEVRGSLAKVIGAQGGSLTHFDHPAGANEVLEWFKQG